MKLYEVPNYTHFKIVESGEVFLLHHLDGMYSFCVDVDRQVAHVSVGTEVEIVEGF